MMTSTKTAAHNATLRPRRKAAPGQSALLLHHILLILPRVQKLLSQWRVEALPCPDPVLRQMALASLKHKAFHCQGGAVFAALSPKYEKTLLRIIVAYQTLCDYLDNLCDRAGSTDGKAFRHLHNSLLTALTPGSTCGDYYLYYPYKEDGGYINGLVEECQTQIETLPNYWKVQQRLWELANWYSELQVRKHLNLDVREEQLISWASQQSRRYIGVRWQEFAAATGSTLAVFALLGLACREELDDASMHRTWQAYFPWICGLHILLDYFIDREEDLQGGDLNFTFYYRNEAEMEERLKYFIYQAHDCAASMPNQAFHTTVVEGLLGLYLSDLKIPAQSYQAMAQSLLQCSGPRAVNTYRICRMVRKVL
jgi:tetraprenyl-beta-curcumene synthase